MKSTKRILVVDDTEEWLVLTEKWLTDEGFECDCAGSAYMAIEYLRKKTYDLIVIDLYMPQMSGLKLYDYILLRYNTIVVVISNSMDEYIKMLPFKHKYQKPNDRDKFLKIVKTLTHDYIEELH